MTTVLKARPDFIFIPGTDDTPSTFLVVVVVGIRVIIIIVIVITKAGKAGGQLN